MNITSEQKTAIMGALLIAAGGVAFVYFDPLGLDLFGQQRGAQLAAAPKTQPRAAAPKAAAPAPNTTPIAAPSATTTTTTATAPSAPAAAKPSTAPVAVAPAAGPTDQPSLKMTKSLKSATAKPVSPPSADLRHCLDKPTNQEIAQCAGE